MGGDPGGRRARRSCPDPLAEPLHKGDPGGFGYLSDRVEPEREELQSPVTSLTRSGTTSALLDPSRSISISSRHLSDRSRLRSPGGSCSVLVVTLRTAKGADSVGSAACPSPRRVHRAAS